MALYHCSISNGSRASGQSAVAKMSYILREEKYEDRPGFIAGESGNLPSWTKGNARNFWTAADDFSRVNGRLFTEIECAIPIELNLEDQLALVREFSKKISVQGGGLVPYTWGMHEKNGNPHFHLELSSRADDGIERKDGKTWFSRASGGKKAVEQGGCKSWAESTDKDWIENIRSEWADIANQALVKAKITCAPLDHRSLKDQGIDRIPTIHVGYGRDADLRAAKNLEITAINNELAATLKERAALVAAEAVEAAIAQAAQDVAQALDLDEKTAPAVIVATANQDLAGEPLTPREIELVRQKLAQPALALPELRQDQKPTIAELEIQLNDVKQAAQQAGKSIAKAKADKERASQQKYVFAAREALPAAMKKLETAKANLKAMEVRGLPWWAPWRRPAMEAAKDAYGAAKTQAQDIKRESRLPVLEEVEKASREAEKKLAEAQSTRERIEQMLNQDTLETAQNTVTALLLGDAARAKAAADKIKNK